MRPMDSSLGQEPQGPGRQRLRGDGGRQHLGVQLPLRRRRGGEQGLQQARLRHGDRRQRLREPLRRRDGTVYPDGYWLHRRGPAPGVFSSSGSAAVRAFTSQGLRWGGLWTDPDYQHFDPMSRRAAVCRAAGAVAGLAGRRARRVRRADEAAAPSTTSTHDQSPRDRGDDHHHDDHHDDRDHDRPAHDHGQADHRRPSRRRATTTHAATSRRAPRRARAAPEPAPAAPAGCRPGSRAPQVVLVDSSGAAPPSGPAAAAAAATGSSSGPTPATSGRNGVSWSQARGRPEDPGRGLPAARRLRRLRATPACAQGWFRVDAQRRLGRRQRVRASTTPTSARPPTAGGPAPRTCSNQPAYNYAQVIGYNEARTPGQGLGDLPPRRQGRRHGRLRLAADLGRCWRCCGGSGPGAVIVDPLSGGPVWPAGQPASRQSGRHDVRTVAMLTAGGLAPCLSSAVGGLIERYTEVAPDVRIIAYRNGYAGLLTGDSVEVTDEVRAKAHLLHRLRRQPDRQQPGQADQRQGLREARPGPGGPGPAARRGRAARPATASTSCTPSAATTPTPRPPTSRPTCTSNGYELTVVGLPKTIDNDVVPIRQSLGAWTAAEQGAIFARNVIAEHSSNPRMLIVHEVMGRNCGWLTAATAKAYREWVRAAGVRRLARELTPGAGTCTRSTCPSGRSTSTPRPSGCARSWTSTTASTSSSPRAPASHEIVAEMEAAGRGGRRATRSATCSSTRSTRGVVRQAVRRAARRREGAGAEERLLRPLRRRQRRTTSP